MSYTDISIVKVLDYIHELKFNSKEIIKATTWVPRNNDLSRLVALNLAEAD